MLGSLLLALMLVTPTDQTVPVTKGTKLDVNNFAGDVIVKVWDKDAVRVEVNHSDREVVDIKPGEQTLSVRSRSVRGGPPRSLDYTITVPKWMAIAVSGTYADVTLDGVGGDVTIETTRGDIKVTGGSGFVSLKSVQGQIVARQGEGPHRGARDQRRRPARRHQRRHLRRVDQRQPDPRSHRFGERRSLHRQRQHHLRRPDQGQGTLPADHAQWNRRHRGPGQSERDADRAHLQRRLQVQFSAEARRPESAQALHRHPRHWQRARRTRVIRRVDPAPPAG